MGKNFFMLVLLVIAAFLINLSCEKKTTKSETRWDAIRAIIINENPDIFLVDVFDTDKDISVEPIFFREITSQDFDLEKASYGDPDASHPFPYVETDWGDSVKGVFHYFIDGKEHTKPIYAHSVMRAYFEQWGDVYDTHQGWLLKKISGNVITSVDTRPRELASLHITSSGVDTVLYPYEILNLAKFSRWRPEADSTLCFGMGEEITFTVEPKDTTDYLFLHFGEDGNFKKFPFLSNGDGTFSRTCTTTSQSDIAEGYKHAFVEAISHDALTDTTAKYDSKTWGILYRIK